MNVNLMLLGAVMMADFMIVLFFLRFFRITRDRFFLFFAASFLIDGASRGLLGALNQADEYEPQFYFLRFLGFLLIIYAIIDKNRPRKAAPAPDA